MENTDFDGQTDAQEYVDPTQAAGPRWTYGKRGYALAQSLRQLKRHKFASLITLLVLGITLTLPIMLAFTSKTLAQLGSKGLQGESVTAYLNTDVSDLDGASLAKQWLTKPGIANTRYVSRSEALGLLKENSDISEAINALGHNPLPGAIIVYPDSNTVNAARVEALVTQLRALDSTARVQFDLRWVKRLQSIVSLVQLVGGLLAVFLTLTALLVIANTIRLELLRRRSEMEVASLLGAGAGFMNRPVLYTGIIYGFIGGLIACTIAVFTFNSIRQPADKLSSLYESTFQMTMPNSSQILTILGISIILGLVGAISSLYRPSQQSSHFGTGQR